LPTPPLPEKKAKRGPAESEAARFSVESSIGFPLWLDLGAVACIIHSGPALEKGLQDLAPQTKRDEATMARILKLDVEKVIPEGIYADISGQERSAMLEVAYLAIAADGKLMEEELDAFVEAMLLLYGPEASPEQVQKVVDHLIQQFEQGDDEALLGSLAAELTRPEARDLAYKLAYAMAMSDLDTDDNEFHFDLRLRKALGIDDQQAEVLVDQVIDAIRPAEG
jgi:hypothetical protein